MKLFLLFCFFFLFAKANAQNTGSIQTDRPDQTETPYTTPKGYIQAEIGCSKEQSTGQSSAFFYPASLFKYGLSDKTELRIITELHSDKDAGKTISGISPVAIGMKINLCEENGIKPKASLIADLSLPFASSKNFKSTYYAPSFRFTMQHSLSQNVSLSYNLGAEWDGETPEPTFIYTLTSGISLTRKLGSYLELYGFAPQKEKADHRFDAGLTYLINDNLLLDLSGGFAITDNAPDHFIAAGFSFRFNTKKKH